LRIHLTITDSSAPWTLTAEAFQRELASYRPDARTHAGYQQRGGDYLEFDLDFDGERREGTYWPGQQLVLNDYPIEEWAPVITWFLGLLPGAAAQCFLDTVPVPQELPRGVTAADVAQILTALDAS
jgi:hypothetical protein